MLIWVPFATGGIYRDTGSPRGIQPSAYFVGAGLAAYVFGGPVVHWAHGDVGKGFGSLGLTVGIPLGAGGLCAISYGGDGGWAALGCFVGGVVLGTLAAPIIDAAVLAYEPADPNHTALRAAKRGSRIQPDVRVAPDGTAILGVRGAF